MATYFCMRGKRARGRPVTGVWSLTLDGESLGDSCVLFADLYGPKKTLPHPKKMSFLWEVCLQAWA